MTKIVAFSNNRGGVGKTTCSIHYTCYLRERGHKVLGVDLEYPGFFSRFFNQKTSLANDPAIMSLFDDTDKLDKPTVIDDNFHIYQAYDKLAMIDKDTDAVFNFRENLPKIAANYDYVVIDTPPLINTRLDCVLAASTHIIVPLVAKTYAIDGFANLLARYTKMRRQLNNHLPKIPFCLFNLYVASRSSSDSLIADFFDDYPESNYTTSKLRLLDAVEKGVKSYKPMWAAGAKRKFKDEFIAAFDDVHNYVIGAK